MEEIWKDIEGYEGAYQISSLGRVKSIKFSKEKILKPCFAKNKRYAMITLCKNGENKGFNIHRLVAKAFIPNPDNLPQVNHKDEDKSNNRIENLEWCDNKYNCNYGTRNERGVKTRLNYPTISKPVLALKNGKICMYFKSTMEAQRYGFNNSKISGCCNGKGYTHMGYEWMYLDDYLADWWDMEMEKAA